MAQPPVSDLGMPLEWEYTDDVDFANEEREPLDLLLPTACSTLKDCHCRPSDQHLLGGYV